jgi:hypothetical protein
MEQRDDVCPWCHTPVSEGFLYPLSGQARWWHVQCFDECLDLSVIGRP